MSDPVTIKVVDRVRVEVGGGPPGSSGTWGTIVGTLANQTDLAAALDAKVEPDTPVNHLTFNTTPTAVPTDEGTVSWDSVDHTLNLQTDILGVVQQVGQEILVPVRNTTGSTILDGAAVAITGSSGEHMTVEKAIATSAVHAASTIGVVTADIADNAVGYMTAFGRVRDVATNGYSGAEGTPLYVSAAAAGELTSTKPSSPNHAIRVGWIEKKAGAGSGRIFVSCSRLSSAASEIYDATTAGMAVLTVANPGAIVFPRFNADNTVTLRSAADYRTDLGVGTSGLVEFQRIKLAAGGTGSGTAPLKLTTQASPLVTEEQGTFELVGNSLQFTQLVKRRGVAMSQSTRVSDTVVANTTVESDPLITAKHGANYLEEGKCEEIVLRGTIKQITGGSQLQIRVKYAGVTLQTITTATGAIAAGTPFEIRVATTCRSTGASGSMQFNSVLWIDGFSNLPDSPYLATIDTTTEENTEVTAQWTLASVDNILTINQGRVLCIEPNR